ncbi:vWA domain-containing protein [Succinimonas sp.]|uniref:vWA domain-containing protein n=1 Tax=Succinimonas sp. TaxID=1936151 RepID=UPI003867B89A
MLRRLPIFFLIDVSGRMKEHLGVLDKGLRLIVDELSGDPYSLETACISAIVFAERAAVLSKLTEVYALSPFDIPYSGGEADYSAGFEALIREIRSDVVKSTAAQKGDWRPLVFLFTAGGKISRKSIIDRWQRDYARNVSVIVFSLSDQADYHYLGQLSDQIYEMKDLNGSAVRSFFKWISASIQAGSAAVTDSGDCFSKHEMPDAEIDNVRKIDPEQYRQNSRPAPAPRPEPAPAPRPDPGSDPAPVPRPAPQADPWKDPARGFKTIIKGGMYVAGIDFPPGYVKLSIQKNRQRRYYGDDGGIYYAVRNDKSVHVIKNGFFSDNITLNLEVGQSLEIGDGGIIELSQILVDWD